MSSQNRNRNNGFSDNKQEVVSITYEEIGLFPRSFSRVLDRFLKQIFSDVENLVIQEYRFYRYLFLTTFKSLCLLFLVPFFVNFLAKNYVIRPLTEYFWNTKQTEVFLNSYQQKRAFAELKDFEEKLYFESLIYPKSAFHSEHTSKTERSEEPKGTNETTVQSYVLDPQLAPAFLSPTFGGGPAGQGLSPKGSLAEVKESSLSQNLLTPAVDKVIRGGVMSPQQGYLGRGEGNGSFNRESIPVNFSATETTGISNPSFSPGISAGLVQTKGKTEGVSNQTGTNLSFTDTTTSASPTDSGGRARTQKGVNGPYASAPPDEGKKSGLTTSDEKTESLINSYTLKSSLFVYQTREADKNIQQRYQEKTIELAQRYNDQSIEAITNFFGDIVSLLTLFYLFYALEIQINITKSFLLEVFFGLDDSKKSLLILLVTDLLVGYHSSNLWELFFEFMFHHYGLPESQTGIFLLVATLPVLLDVLFKYLIFRHLNRSSPATVATYHAMIE